MQQYYVTHYAVYHTYQLGNKTQTSTSSYDMYKARDVGVTSDDTYTCTYTNTSLYHYNKLSAPHHEDRNELVSKTPNLIAFLN